MRKEALGLPIIIDAVTQQGFFLVLPLLGIGIVIGIVVKSGRG